MILVTGAAGFIGFHLIRWLAEGDFSDSIIAIDNFNDYYSTKLKKDRAAILKKEHAITVESIDINNYKKICKLFQERNKHVNTVIHLAAQAGVRYSIENPRVYASANMVGFSNVIEASRIHNVEHFIYASSSSVYGNCSDIPFNEKQSLKSFESLYAVSKASNEMTASVYSKLYSMKTTGLRFFTVYGSWGRPDMAYYSFADAIRAGKTIKVFNNGNLERDFTHVSDIVSGIGNIVVSGPKSDSAGLSKIYNIGRGKPISLLEFISVIESAMGKKANKEMVPMQPGDVKSTWADVSMLKRDYGYQPCVDLKDGINEFITWYREYHHV